MALLLAWAAPAQAAVTSGTITFNDSDPITAPIRGIAFNDAAYPWMLLAKNASYNVNNECPSCPNYMAGTFNGTQTTPGTGTIQVATSGDTFNLKGFKVYDYGVNQGQQDITVVGGVYNTKLTVTPYWGSTAGTPIELPLTRQPALQTFTFAFYNVTRVDIASDKSYYFLITDIEVEAGTAPPAAPTVTPGNIGLTGASGTGGIYKIGDTVTASWNNAGSGGDNNSGITGVTMDFSQFGGGTAVTATENMGIWEATYTITAGSIQQTNNRNVSVTATSSGGSTTTGGGSNAVVDNLPPSVTSIAVKGTPAAGDTSMVFTVTFNESVLNLSTDDFTLVGTGTVFGNIVSISASSGTSVDVNIAGITGSGTLKINLNGSTNIKDTAGNGPPASYSSGTTHSVAIPVAPGAPTIGTATAGNGQATVTFTAPANNGGAAITSYTVTSSPGGLTGTGSSSPITVTGLDNGTTYTFTVTATNSAGTSSASAASSPATPKGSQTITFTNPGTQNFGTTPTLAASTSSGLAVTFTSTTPSVCTISSSGVLTFAAVGLCTIEASQAGDDTWLAATVPQSFTVSAVAPSAPTVGAVTEGDTSASVAFTAPTNNGGAAITSYTVTASPGGATGTGAASPITVTGLDNGTTYTFTVTATNSAGTSSASAASSPATPKGSQTITFTNPGTQNFGTTPTLAASTSSGLAVTFTSTTPSVCTISSSGTLTFVSAGTCIIEASQAGDGTWLAATVSQSFTVSAVAPSAPTIGTATAGDTQATVTFTAPTNNGGAAITSYTVTASPGGATGTGAASPITVTGLTNGTTYTFTVTATNSAGTSSASASSSTATPKGSQTITFTNPGTQNFGTTPTLTASTNSSLAVTFTSTTPSVCTISSSGVLTFAAVGLCTIEASQAGDNTWLAATVSQSFTVSAVAPGAPTIGTATAGDTQATVTFTAPTSNGGTAITGYTVTSSPGGLAGTGSSSPITVSGLTNGTTYTFTVAATNSAGEGTASAASNSVMPSTVVQGTVPTPTSGTGTTGTATATVGALDAAQDPNCRLAAALFASEVPPGYTVSYGSFEFEATNCQHGVTISLTYPQALPLGVRFMKFGPPSSGAPDDWMDWTSLVTVSADRKTVTYSVLDNDAGDSDTRPGFIADPIIPAALGAPGPVSPAAIPTLGHWALVLLSALVGGLAWRRKTGASA